MGKSFNWMPILKTGTFTAKNGKKVTFQESDLDKIVANTDLTTEPQFVVEHPSYDKLGFGTIAELKRIGNYLFALPKHVEEKFKKAVNSGELPGRSVSIDENNFGLSSIGFLPKEISPAVDGLGSYAFSSENTSAQLQLILPGAESHFAEIENNKYEFSLEVSSWTFKSIQTILRNIKNWIIGKESLEVADNLIPEYYLNDAGTPPTLFENNTNQSPTTNSMMSNQFSTNISGATMKLDFSKIDLTKLPQEIKDFFIAAKNEIISLETDLGTSKTELQAATSKISAAELEKNRVEVLAFCESPEMRLRILPADKEKIVNMLLVAKEKGVIELSSTKTDGTKIQFSAFDYTKELLKQLPVKIELQEIAVKKNAGDDNQTEYQKVGAEIAAFVNKK